MALAPSGISKTDIHPPRYARKFWVGGSCIRFPPTLHHPAYGTPPVHCNSYLLNRKKKTDQNHYERDQPARRKSMTERSERIDEEAEVNW